MFKVQEQAHARAPERPSAVWQRSTLEAGRGAALIDNRPAGVAQRAFASAINNSPHALQLKAIADTLRSSPLATQQKALVDMVGNRPVAQRMQMQRLAGAVPPGGPETGPEGQPQHRSAPNRTGMPGGLKAGVEALSGMSMDHVNVHYNSAQPAKISALAYAQGRDIHVGPGQEKHLPHEAWHVVQQAQGRVRPTTQLETGVSVNDDKSLELEADRMGHAAMRAAPVTSPISSASPVSQARSPLQARFFLMRQGPILATDRQVETWLQEANYLPENGMPLDVLVRKLGQGPDIFFHDHPSLIEAVQSRLEGRAGAAHALPKAAGGGAFRKIYRLFGQILHLPQAIYALHVALARQVVSRDVIDSEFTGMSTAVQSLTPDLHFLLHAPDVESRGSKGAEILRNCNIILTNFSVLLTGFPADRDFRYFWLCFNILSAFGPLSYAIQEDARSSGAAQQRDLAGLGEPILVNLRHIRQGLSRRPTLAVVAHRGTGPTNRNMGGLIAQHDDRRTKRLAKTRPRRSVAPST